MDMNIAQEVTESMPSARSISLTIIVAWLAVTAVVIVPYIQTLLGLASLGAIALYGIVTGPLSLYLLDKGGGRCEREAGRSRSEIRTRW